MCGKNTEELPHTWLQMSKIGLGLNHTVHPNPKTSITRCTSTTKHSGWAGQSNPPLSGPPSGKPVWHPSSGLYYSGLIVGSLFLMHNAANYLGTVMCWLPCVGQAKHRSWSLLCQGHPCKDWRPSLGEQASLQGVTGRNHSVQKLVKPRFGLETHAFYRLHHKCPELLGKQTASTLVTKQPQEDHVFLSPSSGKCDLLSGKKYWYLRDTAHK